MSFQTPRPRVDRASVFAIGRFLALALPMFVVTGFAWLELGPRWGILLGMWIGVLELVALEAGL